MVGRMIINYSDPKSKEIYLKNNEMLKVYICNEFKITADFIHDFDYEQMQRLVWLAKNLYRFNRKENVYTNNLCTFTQEQAYDTDFDVLQIQSESMESINKQLN